LKIKTGFCSLIDLISSSCEACIILFQFIFDSFTLSQ
jgi:hypothetical protein